MALRGTGYAKRAAGTAATQAGGSARALSEAETATRTVPLDLSALVSPYRGHGRISLRVERLPHRTRLSRGQNNGDRSWSLSLDDLDGLNYLAPQDLRGHRRSPSASSAWMAAMAPRSPFSNIPFRPAMARAPAASPKVVSSSSATVDDKLAVRLREELDKLKAANAAQEAALAQLRQSTESEWEAKAQLLLDTELKAARRNWEDELKKKLAEAAKRSSAEIKQLREEAAEERDARSAQAEKLAASKLQEERQRWQKESEAALAIADKNWKAAEERSRLLSAQLDAKDRSQKDFEALLAKAEKGWKDGEAKRLLDAETHWQARAAKEAAELRTKAESAWKSEEAARHSAAKAEWQATMERTLADALARANQDTNNQLAQAQAAWKSDEATRLAVAESRWQEQTDRLVAETRAKASIAGQADEAGRLSQLRAELANASKVLKDRGDELAGTRRKLEDAELRLQRESAARTDAERLLKQLREDLAAANNRATDRDSELANARQEAAATQLRLQRDAEAALSHAREKWSADEAARTAAAERVWHERVASNVAEARAQALATGKADESSQISQLREELTSIGRTLTERDNDLVQLRRAASEASDRLPQQIAIALSDAQKIWAREESVRFAEGESKWRERTEKEVSEARASASAVPDDGAELVRLRSELKSLRQTLGERDGDLARAQLEHSTASDTALVNYEDALAEARSAWAAAEAARLAAAEESWREQAQAELATAIQRYKQAEAELAETLARGGEGRSPRDKVEILRLREEVENLKSTVAIRDVELSQAHATAEQMRKRLDLENEEILPGLNRGRRMSDRARGTERDETGKRPIWRDIALVAAVAAFGILLYPRIVALVPDDWWPASSYSDDSTPDAAPHRPAPAPAAVPPTDIVAHAANVRSGPAKTASVVATLDRDVAVWTIEKKGNWVHIEFSTGDAKKHDGWVFNTFLKPAPAVAATPDPTASH